MTPLRHPLARRWRRGRREDCRYPSRWESCNGWCVHCGHREHHFLECRRCWEEGPRAMKRNRPLRLRRHHQRWAVRRLPLEGRPEPPDDAGPVVVWGTVVMSVAAVGLVVWSLVREVSG